MTTPLKIKLVECNAAACSNIKDAVNSALYMAKLWNCLVRFEFNGVGVNVGPDSDATVLINAQQSEQRRERRVGA